MNFHDLYIRNKTAYGQLNNQTAGSDKYTIFVREPWFSLIKTGIKKVEGRPNKGLFEKFKIGDTVIFSNKDKFGHIKTVRTKIFDKKIYKTFEQLIENEGIDNILPNQGFTSVSQAVNVYRQWYSESDEQNGVVGIHLVVLP